MSLNLAPEEVLRPFLKKKEETYEIKHDRPKRILLFPYSTKMDPGMGMKLQSDFKNFDGLIGECYRLTSNKDFPEDLKKSSVFKTALKDSILASILTSSICSEDDLQPKLKSVIESFFFINDNLVKFSQSALPYMNWANPHPGFKNKANFVKSIFLSEGFKHKLQACGDEEKNILFTLVNDSLPPLVETTVEKTNPYTVLAPNVVEYFQRDFDLLIKDQKWYLKDVEKLFKYYYFFYISTTAVALNNFFNDKDPEIFFTLTDEVFFENRKAFRLGWRKLEPRIQNIFSHAICLEILNHIPLFYESGPSDYSKIKSIVSTLNDQQREELANTIRDITIKYVSYLPKMHAGVWDSFETFQAKELGRIRPVCPVEKAIIELWCRIEYQFQHSDRKKNHDGYANWFKFFCKENFLKNRGRNGSSLSLSNDMLLFLTKLCVGDNKKIRLKELWQQFALRGIHFDDASQRYIINLFEKINLLEKKSDSGDAQYVKSVL